MRALVFLLLGASTALAQPAKPDKPDKPDKRPAPAPAPVAPAPVAAAGKPELVYPGRCPGTKVYISSKDYRECCILCDAGNDAMSKVEIADAERIVDEWRSKHPMYINIDARQILNLAQGLDDSSSGRMSAFSGGGKGAAKTGDKGKTGDKPEGDKPYGGNIAVPSKF